MPTHKKFSRAIRVKFALPVLALLVGIVWASLPSGRVQAANPQLISFQGKVVNSNGTNVTTSCPTNYTFSFVLFDDPTLGSESDGVHDKWHELSKTVSVCNGVFQTNLGSATALPDFNSLSSLYLAVKFNGDAAGYMTPRIRMTSVPYALNSETLSGLAATNFVQLAQGVQTDSSTTNPSIGINKTGGTANILTLQKSGANVLTLSNSGLLTFQPATDSTTALSVLRQSDSAVVLAADTTNRRIGIGTNPTNAVKLDILIDTATEGGITLKGASGQAGTGNGHYLVVKDSGNTTLIDINQYGNLDLRQGLGVQGVFGAGAEQSNVLIKPSNSQKGIVIKAGATPGADFVELQDSNNNIFSTINSSGQLTVKPFTDGNAVQVQRGSDGKEIFTVDTSGNQVLLGKAGTGNINGKIVFNTATASSFQVGIQGSGSTTASYNLTLPTALPGSSQCLQSDNAGLLSFTSCGGGTTTLATAYSNGSGTADSLITLDTTRAGVVIQDAVSPIGSDLFTVRTNGGGGTKIFNVTAGGAAVIGTYAQTTTLSASGTALQNTVTINGTAASQTYYGDKLAVTNNQATNANTVYGQYVSFTDAGSLANTVTGLYVDATTANTADTTYAAVLQGGNVGIGTATPTDARLVVKASTTDSSDYALRLKNSSGANIFSVRNDQKFDLGSGSENTQLTISGTGSLSGIYSPAYSSSSTNIIKYKDFNGTANLTLDMSQLTATSGTNSVLLLNPVYNQASGTASNTDLLINRTQTAIGSGAQYMIDAQVGSASKFSVSNAGVIRIQGGQTSDFTTASAATANGITVKPGDSTAVNGTGAGLALNAGDQTGTTCSSSNCTGGTVTIQGGSATGGAGTTRNGGNVTIDAGTGNTANGTVSIGTANSATTSIGRSGGTTGISGNSSSFINFPNFNVSTGGIVTVQGNQAPDITSKVVGGAANALQIAPGDTSVNDSTGATLTLRGGNETGTGAAFGGGVSIQGGTGNGASNSGSVSIGTSNTQSVSIGASGKTTTINGSLTVSGGNLALGANNLTLTGDIASSGTRAGTGYFTGLNVTNTITGSISGNAATATALQNARNIGGVSFNGTADITVASATGGFSVSGGDLVVTRTSTSAFAVGQNGTTTPALLVDSNTASSVTGLKITSAGAGAGVALAAISSAGQANENLTIDAKGAGTITIGGTSTGGITLNRATTISNGNLGLGANSLTLTGDIATTGSRAANGYFTNLAVTNAISGSVTGSAATVTGATQSAITSVGTLTGLTVTGTTSINTTGSGTTAIGNSGTDWNITSGGALSLGRASTTQGALVFYGGSATSHKVTIQAHNNAAFGADYVLTLPDALPGSTQCLQSDNTGALSFATCGGGSQTLSQVYTASSADSYTMAVTNASGLSFNFTGGGTFKINDNGLSGLVYDPANSILKIFENTGSPSNYAQIYYDNANSEAVFGASSGTTRIGTGSGNISFGFTDPAHLETHTHTGSLAGTYSSSDFKFERSLTGTSFALNGNVFEIRDSSSFTSGSSAPNVLYINQNNTSATGNLIFATTGGSGTAEFKVDTTGLITGNGGATIGGGALSLTGNAASLLTTSSGALTLTSAAATTWSTTAGNLTVQGGSGTVSLGSSTILTNTGASLTITSNSGSDLYLNSTVALRPGSDSVTGIQFQNASSTSILNLDTTNSRVGIGTTSPVDALDVKGNILIEDQPDATAHTFTNTCSCSLNSAAGTWGVATARDGVSASVVYKGKLFVATREADGAAVYRYDGGTTWTLVTNVAGKVLAGDTANIDAFVMTVYDGRLFIGTQTGTAASPTGSTGALFYSSNADTGDSSTTTWTQVNTTKGSFGMSQTTLSGISDMAVFNGTLYIATLSGSVANNLEVGRWNGLDGASAVFTQINATDGKTAAEATADADGAVLQVFNGQLMIGAITASTTARVASYSGVGTATTSINLTVGTFGAEASNINVTSMAVYNGSLYVAVSKANAAAVYRWSGTTATGTHTVGEFLRVNQTVGKLDSGDTANIDSIILRVYRGTLYAGSQGTTGGENSAGLYLYDGNQVWTLQNGTRGTFNSDANIDGVDNLISYNGTMYVGTIDSTNGVGAMYSWSQSSNLSYGLKFEAPNGNFASIAFSGSEKSNDNQGNTGGFVFSNSVMLNSAAFDYAEDYPTFDTNLEPGDPVSVDPSSSEHVKLARPGENVLGVVSKNPGMTLSSDAPAGDGATWVPIALVGRVPVNVTTNNGADPIKAGDNLALSGTPGVLQKAKTAGQIVGTALASYDSATVGQVSMFVKPGWDGNFATLGAQPNSALAVAGLTVNSGNADAFSIKNQQNQNVVSFDSQGNATFNGTVTADKIKANQIEGLEIWTDKISSLQDKVAAAAAKSVSSTNSAASQASPTPGLDTAGKVSFNNVEAVNLVVLAQIESKGGLVVDKDAQFNGKTIFALLAQFNGDAEFNAQVTFNNDHGGAVVIKKDAKKVSVVFGKEYPQAPIVTANWILTDTKDADGKVTDPAEAKQQRLVDGGYIYYVANVTTKGFDILLNKNATEDLSLNWLATTIKDPHTTVSILQP